MYLPEGLEISILVEIPHLSNYSTSKSEVSIMVDILHGYGLNSVQSKQHVNSSLHNLSSLTQPILPV